jgi:hypothetical protein
MHAPQARRQVSIPPTPAQEALPSAMASASCASRTQCAAPGQGGINHQTETEITGCRAVAKIYVSGVLGVAWAAACGRCHGRRCG